MNSNHLATGSAFPVLKDGKLRLYNMRFCPFGHRAVLVALAKEIPLDIVNVHLKQKPEWLFDRNPTGKVPTIETAQGPLYESLIVSDYLDDVYSNRPLKSIDPFQRALDRIWIENFSKAITIFYKSLDAWNDLKLAESCLTELSEAIQEFEAELTRRGTLYFGGNDQPGMMDYMIWPWFERFPIFEIFFPSLYKTSSAYGRKPALDKWRQAMLMDPAVKKFLVSTKIHHKFRESYLTGNLQYDGYDLDCSTS